MSIKMLTKDLMAAVEAIYDISGTPSIEHYIVPSTAVREFVTSFRTLKRLTSDDRDDVQIRSFLNILSTYQYLMTSSPIPLSHPVIIDSDTDHALKRLTYHIVASFSEYRPAVLKTINLYLSLYRLNTNPLAEYLVKHPLADNLTELALLVGDTRLVEPTQEVLSTISWLESAEVLTPRDLRRLSHLDDLIVFGPLHRIPDYVMTASRARSIHVIRYGYIRDAWEFTTAFTHPIVSRRRPSHTKIVEQSDVEDEWQPDTELIEVVQQLTSPRSDANALDVIDARVALLANSYVVLLDANPSTTELIIDLDTDDSPVQRVAVQEVHAGTFVLLRTDGGGDYVVTIADQILAQRAAMLRTRQRRWKDLLRGEVRRSDLVTVACQLLDLGSTRADEQNVRNWMSYRSISTQALEDFDAIMKLVGLESESEQYWQSMKEIRRAHQRAGQRIRKLLLARVRNADLDELERTGILEFSLDEVDGGTLTAFRVERLLRETVQAMPHRLGHPYSTAHFNAIASIVGLEPLYGSSKPPAGTIPNQMSLDLILEQEVR